MDPTNTFDDHTPIDPEADPRVSWETAPIGGIEYGYMLGQPAGRRSPLGTVILLHGWPDLAAGWRFQVPALQALGFRVVVPDLPGFGGTGGTGGDDVDRFSFRRVAGDVAELAARLGAGRVVVGGHDWGAAVTYRLAEHHPRLVSHFFTVSVPYPAPARQARSLAEIARQLPSFGYQLQLADGTVERALGTDPARIRQFLAGIYGGRTPDGQALFDPRQGFALGQLAALGPPPLMDERTWEYYTREYSRRGFAGPNNWYRTTQVNYENDKDLPAARDGPISSIPCLFIQTTRDTVFPDEMVRRGMAHLPQAEIVPIEASHWALIQKPEEVNGALRNWFRTCVIPDLEGRNQSKY